MQKPFEQIESEESPLLLVVENVCRPSSTSNLFETNDSLEKSLFLRNSFWIAYNKQLDKNPLLVKCVTAFLVLGLGDVSGQGVEYLQGTARVDGLDWIRALRFGMFGVVGAPWSHYYFSCLDYYLPPTEEPFTATTAIKLLIDQGLQAPALLAIIITSQAAFKGGGTSEIERDLKRNYMDALTANWKLWIPASLVNLAFVKPSLRVLYVNVVFFVWTIILSVMLNESQR